MLAISNTGKGCFHYFQGDLTMPRKKLPEPAPSPLVRPTPPLGEVKNRMIGEPAGRIPAVMPRPWDSMVMVGDEAHVIHAVPTGTRALCGDESSEGWLWQRGHDVTCERCIDIILQQELDADSIVQRLRRDDVPVTRENWISFNYAGCSIRPWTAEHEDSLPRALQDWPRLFKLAKRRSQRRKFRRERSCAC
jgi:hypothetical protein